MQAVKQFEITLETGERHILTETDIQKGTRLFYTDVGPGFGAEAVISIRQLPHERIQQKNSKPGTQVQ